MSKEHLFVKLKMWVEEGEDGQPTGIRYSYKLPNVENEMIMELYKIFLETLCNEIAQLDGADQILSVLNIGEQQDEQEGENKS